MSSHKKDLRPWRNKSRDAARVVIVTDGQAVPLLKSLYINGAEILAPEGAGLTLELSACDIPILNVPMIPSSCEIITEAEAEERIIKE